MLSNKKNFWLLAFSILRDMGLNDFLSGCGYVTSFLPVCADSKFPRSGEERLSSHSQNQQSPWGTQKSFRTISLLCVPYKILERIIYARVEPLIDPLLLKEQAVFRRGVRRQALFSRSWEF